MVLRDVDDRADPRLADLWRRHARRATLSCSAVCLRLSPADLEDFPSKRARSSVSQARIPSSLKESSCPSRNPRRQGLSRDEEASQATCRAQGRHVIRYSTAWLLAKSRNLAVIGLREAIANGANRMTDYIPSPPSLRLLLKRT